MSINTDLEKLAGELADAKAAKIVLASEKENLEGDISSLESEKTTLETSVSDMQAQLDTANQVITKYKDAEEIRQKEQRKTLVDEADALRVELELPERDYSKYTLETIMADIETLTSLPKTGGPAAIIKDEDAIASAEAERKEDLRELIFKTRRDGKPKKGLIRWSE
jgi:chromosome segregation ATPase